MLELHAVPAGPVSRGDLRERRGPLHVVQRIPVRLGVPVLGAQPVVLGLPADRRVLGRLLSGPDDEHGQAHYEHGQAYYEYGGAHYEHGQAYDQYCCAHYEHGQAYD